MDKARRIISRIARYGNPGRMVKLTGQSLVFPFYHTVARDQLPHITHLYRMRSVEAFEQDLEDLLRWFEPVSIGAVLKEPGMAKNGRKMVLTFDDGLAECHQIIAPLLRKKGVPALFFLNNDFIDNRALFFRYKASLLIHALRENCCAREKAADYLAIQEDQAEEAIRLATYAQQPLLEGLAAELDLSFSDYLKDHPVYMTTGQVKELLSWGFDIGGHSMDHPLLSALDPGDIITQVISSVDELQQRFGVSTRYFSFPFTSDGIPEHVIDALLGKHQMDALFGTAGIKRTGKPGFMQRIPMELFDTPALEAIKAELLYYLIKQPFGRNIIRY